MQCARVMPSTACLTLLYFPTLSHKRPNSREKEKVTEHKMVAGGRVDFLYNFRLKHVSFQEGLKQDIIKNEYRSSCNVPVIIVRFKLNSNILDKFSKNTEIQNFMKIPPVGEELFHADGRT